MPGENEKRMKHLRSVSRSIHGYLTHKKQPPPLGPPQGHRHTPTVRFCGRLVSYERGTPVERCSRLLVTSRKKECRCGYDLSSVAMVLFVSWPTGANPALLSARESTRMSTIRCSTKVSLVRNFNCNVTNARLKEEKRGGNARQGHDLRIKSSEIRVQRSGCRGQDSGFMVQV